MQQKQIEDFWSKVDLWPSYKKCWNWNGVIQHYGYGMFKIGDKYKMVHRLSYEMIISKVPANKEIYHLCRNRRCVNPTHMEITTHRINTLRGNTITGNNSRKVYCPKGHILAGDNLCKFALRNQRRLCRICYNTYSKQYHKKHNS